MRLRRSAFFGLLLVIITGPPVLVKFWWIVRSERTVGVFYFESPGNPLDQIRFPTSHIQFLHGTDTIEFFDRGNLGYREGAAVPVRYDPKNPDDAHVDGFLTIWGGVAIYCGFPVLLLMIFFFHPQIIPYGASIRIDGRRPFLHVK